MRRIFRSIKAGIMSIAGTVHKAQANVQSCKSKPTSCRVGRFPRAISGKVNQCLLF